MHELLDPTKEDGFNRVKVVYDRYAALCNKNVGLFHDRKHVPSPLSTGGDNAVEATLASSGILTPVAYQLACRWRSRRPANASTKGEHPVGAIGYGSSSIGTYQAL